LRGGRSGLRLKARTPGRPAEQRKEGQLRENHPYIRNLEMRTALFKKNVTGFQLSEHMAKEKVKILIDRKRREGEEGSERREP